MREVAGANLTCKFYLCNIKVALPVDVLPGNSFLHHWQGVGVSSSPELQDTW